MSFPQGSGSEPASPHLSVRWTRRPGCSDVAPIRKRIVTKGLTRPPLISGSLELLPPPRRVGGSLGTIPKRASREGGVRVQSASIVHEFAVLKSARETEKTGLSVGHAARCFEVFDQLIPELGVHARPAKTLRDELWDMVHSDEFTATPE